MTIELSGKWLNAKTIEPVNNRIVRFYDGRLISVGVKLGDIVHRVNLNKMEQVSYKVMLAWQEII